MKNIIKNIINDLFCDNSNEYNFILPYSNSQNGKDNITDDTESSSTKAISNDSLTDADSNLSISMNQFSKIKNVYENIDVNLEYINVRFNSLINSDIKIREFLINVKARQYKAFIIYIDGMVDDKSINDFILNPLMLRTRANQYDGPQVISEAVTNNISVRKLKKFNLTDYISNSLLPQNSVERVNSFDKIAEDVTSGNCVLFVDTINFAFDISVKKYQMRSIAEPKNEPLVKGSKEAFVENLRTNTSMIRRNLCNENLIIENLTVGKDNKNKCAVCYLKNIANSDLVAEVKYRINNLDVQYLVSVGELSEMIKDDIDTSIPEILSTERVDRATSYILQGRVVVIYNGSPYVLIMPVTLIDFLSSPEDANINHLFANALKILRAIAFFVTLTMPGFYIAITTYHRELIPTELLFSVVASRSSVPFMVIVEIIIMELCFEVIREAGLRVPSPLGTTVGIVGALVLGQAAVEADIVSPILIIIVAITAINSFAIPDFSLNLHLRIFRFAYTMLAFLGGFLGMAIGLFIHLLILCSLKSFGISYLSPYAPFNIAKGNGYLVRPPWKREQRSGFLDAKENTVQPPISMKWRKN